MRKSNFFHFIISLFDGQQHRIQVQKAVFKDFYDTIGTVSGKNLHGWMNACMEHVIIHDSLWLAVFLVKVKQKV